MPGTFHFLERLFFVLELLVFYFTSLTELHLIQYIGIGGLESDFHFRQTGMTHAKSQLETALNNCHVF